MIFLMYFLLYIYIYIYIYICIFSLLDSCLFGFLASWLFGFLASWLLGFLACWWFTRLLVTFWLWLFASSAFPVQSRMCLFAGLCGFWWLWLFASSAFPVSLVLALAFRILSITSHSLVESSLRRTSWGAPPKPPPQLFGLFAKI